MLVLKDRILGVSVMSLHTGQELAKTYSAIIDPRHLKIVAFYCKGPTLDFEPAILNTSDIREFGNLGLIIDSAADIVPPEDLVRLQDVLRFNFTIDKLPVVDDSGRRIGRVANYSVETQTFYIAKLHVSPRFLKFWDQAEIIIDRSQIIEITNQKVVVKSPKARSKVRAKARRVVHRSLGQAPAEPAS